MLFKHANKTQLTKQVTSAACQWLDARGVKPIETEVSVCHGWIADIAGAVSPTETELQLLKLVPRKPRWKAAASLRAAWQTEVASLPGLMTVVVEVKTTVADFSRDSKWHQCPAANLNWLAIPRDLVAAERYPVDWGILVFDGSNVRQVCVPRVMRVDVNQQLEFVYAVACRRDNHTRYEHIRRVSERYANERRERVNQMRVDGAVRLAYALFMHEDDGHQFKTVDEALQWFDRYEFRIAHPRPWARRMYDDLWTAKMKGTN